MPERLRLTEILTTSSAVANYLGAPEVEPTHVLLAVEILMGTKTLDDLGRPQSPMISRVTGAGSGVTPEVRELAQRWFTQLSSNPMAELREEELAEFATQVRVLAGGE